ncbi:MAG: cytidine deaminase [Flavobacteriales bacterium]|jgi:cytidine deaminase|nr:cytidine deaminase [Flavobacteriales bacterium]
MAEQGSIIVQFIKHASRAEMPEADRDLLDQAQQAADRAYAPYSNFHVGAALRLSNGKVVTGNNQENASFPAGICAERTALHAAMSLDPDAVVNEIAVVVTTANGDEPVSPCGICRQALLEQEIRQNAPMRIVMGLPNGPVKEVASARALLPLSFDVSFLKG